MIHLCELASQTRATTLTLLANCPTEKLTWCPSGTSNHTLWHAGHVLWVQDVLSIVPLGGSSELPDGWGEMFGMNCSSPRLRTEWPSREYLHELLTTQLPTLHELYRKQEDRLSRIETPSGDGWETTRGVIHGLHDEARHQGEMHLLKKMMSC